MRKLMLVGAVALLSACKPASPPSAPAEPVAPVAIEAPAVAAPDAEATPPVAPPAAPVTGGPAFVDKVWRVQASSGAEPGSTYTFLADGTLVIDSPNGTPMYGRWKYDDGRLTMTEEGVPYPTDILKLDAGTFQIRSNNPGGAVEITLVPAPDATLPTAKAK